jgi:cell division protein FtsZ
MAEETIKKIIEIPLEGQQQYQGFVDGISEDDQQLLQFYESTKPKIYVLGMGGSGSNTLSRMTQIGVVGAATIAMNTDVQHLMKTKADRKLLIGKNTTRGLGAGSDPEVGEAAAMESVEEMKKLFSDASLVFITCGMGGGTGTGSAHVAAKVAKEMGALTVGVVTMPFTSEGARRRENAMKGLENLRKVVDTLIVIPNDKLLSIVPDLPLDTAFRVSDEVLSRAVKGITEMVTVPGLINLDLADLRTILRQGGYAMIGVGESMVDSPYDERALVSVETALSSPLLDVDISTTNRAIINVTGGEDMTLREAELIAAEVAKKISPDAHIIWGARVERNLKKYAIQTLVVLAGAKIPDYSSRIAETPAAPVEAIDLDELDLAV